jgi:hypothetical protein
MAGDGRGRQRGAGWHYFSHYGPPASNAFFNALPWSCALASRTPRSQPRTAWGLTSRPGAIQAGALVKR